MKYLVEKKFLIEYLYLDLSEIRGRVSYATCFCSIELADILIYLKLDCISRFKRYYKYGMLFGDTLGKRN